MPSEAASQPRRIHGGPQDAELRSLSLSPSDVLDFSVNTNPYGPCGSVEAAIRSAAVGRYPDPTAQTACRTLAHHLDVPAASVAMGNGAAELLWTLARLLLRPGDTALIVEPTFCEFRAAAVACGARLAEWRAKEASGFAVDLESIGRQARAEGAAVIYLCSPNTPTGSAVAADDIAAWAAQLPRITIVLDQSFLSLSERSADASRSMPANVICVRSMTKDFAIPGVRLGYLLASPEIVTALETQRPAWTTSAIAQAAAIAACNEGLFVLKSRARMLADRNHMAAALGRIGLPACATTTMFFLVRVQDASDLRLRLLVRHRVLIRDCASFGLPDFIRLGAKPESDVARLVGALQEELTRC